jgi:general secretion pathway protein G
MFAIDGRAARKPHGFTLIEILIVISIIALLTSLVAVHVQRSRREAMIRIAVLTVGQLRAGLDAYVADEGALPGAELRRDPERNDSPALWAALFGTRRPDGPGGRSAPYGGVTHGDIGALDAETGSFRVATRAEREDDAVPKYLLDPWARPYVYRLEPAGKGRGVRLSAAIYSTGPNGEDETAGGGEGGDDVMP